MKKIFLLIILVSVCIITKAKVNQVPKQPSIENGFSSPPDSIKTAIFWYWLNNHISESGAIKDLQAMKKAGINRVFIGTNIRNRINFSRDLTGQYFGNIKVFSDQWWEILHTSLKTASELDLEVGLFNCPGWSQSGGPWIKPEQAMRYLEASELRITGPMKISQQLEKPDSFFQDIKVLAVAVSPDYKRNLLDLPKTKLTPSKLQINHSASKNEAKYILSENESILDIELPETLTVRSLTFYPAEYMTTKIELQVKENGAYKTIQHFNAEGYLTTDNLAKGFEPYAPSSFSLGELNGKFFRIILRKNGPKNSYIKDIVFSSTPILKNLPGKKLANVPGGLPDWGASMWEHPSPYNSEVKVPQKDQVFDISEYMSADGVLNWDVPPGEWIIIRTGMRFIDVQNGPASFEAEGLEVDKMNKQHIQSHFNSFIGEILTRIPENDRKTLKVVVLDSYERGGQNFTDGFLEEFKQRYGYDAIHYLPVLKGHIIGNADLSDRFLWDMRRLIADKISYDYVGGLTEISHKNGLTTWLENYGHTGFAGEFLQYGGQSDEVSGEFWYRPIDDRKYENRGAASAAHIYGKKKVWSESFTSGSWEKTEAFIGYPQKLKKMGDWAFSEGVNSTLLHVYIQQPYENDYPGIDAWFGTEFNRKNTWFSQIDLFTQYHKRCNFMLQQGLNIADVAYFIGEDTPKMTGIRHPNLPKGYNYDYINAEVIIRDMSVKNGKLVLPHGTSYSILVLPPQITMRPELLSKINKLVREGGIILGMPPTQSPSLQNYPNADKEVQTLASAMWGDMSVKYRRYGKGWIMNDISLEEAFKLINITPDCLIDNNSIRYTHRALEGKDIYFLANIGNTAVDFSATFRVNGMQPELWDPLTGTTRLLPAFKQESGTTTIPLHLSIDGSTFIVFQSKGTPIAKDRVANFPIPIEVITMNIPWIVQFEQDSIKRGPTEPVIFTELKDWTQCKDERIRYYSGTAIYTGILTVKKPSKNKPLYLDLGELSAMAKVKVNGQYVGGVWTTPYRVNVTNKIKSGANKIEIEVVNTWMNRLIGDHRLPENQRIVQSKNNKWNANSRLQRSGLFGPVRLLTE